MESFTKNPDPLNRTAVGWINRFTEPFWPHSQFVRASAVIRCSTSKVFSQVLHS